MNKPTKKLHTVMALSFKWFPQDTSKAVHPCLGEAGEAIIGALWSELSSNVREHETVKELINSFLTPHWN